MTTLLRRARVLLGTLVEMRVEGLPEADARAALEAAFAEVERVHCLMSFHERDSDLARIHAAPVGTALDIDARTHEVLAIAQDIFQRSAGLFDISIGAPLVHAGILPRPRSPFEPDAEVSGADIELLDGNRVRLRRPLWIDLGGIAKGYAVDRAIELLHARGVTQACVNAGGDLRVCGARAEPVHVRNGQGALPAQPTLELRDAAIATSTTHLQGAHRSGTTQIAIAPHVSVSVIAERCVIADALTKVVLAGDGPLAARVLARFGASAARHDARHGWMPLELAA